MEADHRYQSVPHNCSLLNTAKTKPIYGEFLELFGFGEVSFEDLKFRAGDEDFVAYVEEAKRIREDHPGLEMRQLELGPERRPLREMFWTAERRTLLHAINGGYILGTSVCSTRGEPIRYLPPYKVKRIVEEFDRTEFDAVAGQTPNPSILQAYRKLEDLYRVSGAFDEGIITIRL